MRQYFCCQKFADLAPAERFKLLKEKGLCNQCLAPGAPPDTNKQRTDCYSKYCCKYKAHDWHLKKKYVLVCKKHNTYKEKRDLLEKRHTFSRYVIDPNKLRLRKDVRISAIVKLFVTNIKKKVRIRLGKCTQINHNEEMIVDDKILATPIDFMNGKY